mgnify:CR=1 FL=1
MAKVELKQPIVEEIANSIKDAQAVVLVNYSGLTVEQDTILRKELREAGVQYKVYKNTMMRRAFEGTAFESLSDHLHGTNAIAISETDATAPARILAKYAKDVKAVTASISQGAGDAGFIYKTDAIAAGDAVQISAVTPADSHDPVIYPIGIIKKYDNALAKDFYQYVMSPEGQKVLEKYGFSTSK